MKFTRELGAPTEQPLSGKALRQENTRLQLLSNQESQQPCVDLCFLVDITASMGVWIDATRNKIKDIVDQVQKQTGFQARVGFVGYRDFGDSPQFEATDFTTDIESFLSFLKGVLPKGGGDIPEDVCGGLQKCLEQNWSSGVRVLIHFADAPGHGHLYHDVDDSKPDFDGDGALAQGLLKQLIGKRVEYYFGQMTNATTKMVSQFKEWYDANPFKITPFTVLPLDADAKDFLQRVVFAVVTSVRRTKLI